MSVALHAAALGVVANIKPPPPSFVASNAIEMEFFVPKEPEPEPVKEPDPVKPPQQLAAVIKKKKDATNTNPPQQPSSPNIAIVNDAPPAVTGPNVGQRGDLPVATKPSLVPSTGFIMSLGPAGTNDSGRGSTVRNGPGEEPDQSVLKEYTGEVLTRKLNGQLREDVGLAAVGAGNVPPHFKRYETAMRKMLPTAKIDKTPLTGKEVLGEVAGMMFNNGPSPEAQAKIANTPTGRSVQNQNVMMPNVDDQRAREGAMAALAQTENIKERVSRPRLRTVLEVTTDASGALADVSVVEKSGDPRFDESVLHFSRKVARTIPDSDDKILGATMWRTRWQFTWEPPDVRVRLLNAWRLDNQP
ncbi:MAG: energy transducer TonB [Archangium sp.]|nr:energy transducer TonB [Archangium sp.]